LKQCGYGNDLLMKKSKRGSLSPQSKPHCGFLSVKKRRNLQMNKLIFSVPLLVLSFQAAEAHHLDNYDSRIRDEAGLPTTWFSCNTTSDCALVTVPCHSDLAVNAEHLNQVEEEISKKYPFCLGSTLKDTAASCEAHQCVTRGVRKSSR
jgi:hypothetical protein